MLMRALLSCNFMWIISLCPHIGFHHADVARSYCKEQGRWCGCNSNLCLLERAWACERTGTADFLRKRDLTLWIKYLLIPLSTVCTVLLWREVWHCQVCEASGIQWNVPSSPDRPLCLCWVEFWVSSSFWLLNTDFSCFFLLYNLSIVYYLFLLLIELQFITSSAWTLFSFALTEKLKFLNQIRLEIGDKGRMRNLWLLSMVEAALHSLFGFSSSFDCKGRI